MFGILFTYGRVFCKKNVSEKSITNIFFLYNFSVTFFIILLIIKQLCEVINLIDMYI